MNAGGVLLPDCRRRVPEAFDREELVVLVSGRVVQPPRQHRVDDLRRQPWAMAASTICPPPCRGQKVGYTDSTRIGRPRGFSLICGSKRVVHGAQSRPRQRLQILERVVGEQIRQPPHLVWFAVRQDAGRVCRAPPRRSPDDTDPNDARG